MSWENIQRTDLKHPISLRRGSPTWIGRAGADAVPSRLLFLYLAMAKDYEPLLLLPIGFGIFLVNFPLTPLMGYTESRTPDLIRFFYKYGVEWEIIPCVIFLASAP